MPKPHDDRREDYRLPKWVGWHDLRNTSLRESIADVRAALERIGLLSNDMATPRAYRRGLVRDVRGEQKWNRTRWLSMQRAIRRAAKARRPLTSKPQRKSKEQLAYEAHNRVRAAKEKRGECEVVAMLEEIGGLAWLKFKHRNAAAEFLWNEHETHHPFGRDQGDHAWNMIRTLKAVHKFAHENPPLGLLACVLVKEKHGALELAEAKNVLGGNGIVGIVYRNFGYGNYSGKAAGAAEAFIARNKTW